MEFLQLQYFYESAKNENFAKTAEKFMVPATSVSAAVRRLEKELGCSLFDRSSNRIALNANGKRLARSLTVVFSELNQAVEELGAPVADNRQIRMLVRAMRKDITDYIVAYHEKYPHIAFKTVFDFSETDPESYDIIIDQKTDRYPTFESFPLQTLRLRMAVSADSPLRSKRLMLKQLSGEAFISMGEQSNTHRILEQACRAAGFTPNIAVSSNDIQCYEKLLRSGIGIGLIRDSGQTLPNIAYLDVADFAADYGICVYYNSRAAYGNILHFLNFLKTQAHT